MAQTRAAAKKSAHSSSSGRSKAAAKRSTRSRSNTEATHKNGHCWPGFEPVAGKKAGTRGSCKRVPGKHSAGTRQATQRSAAASKLEKQGKANPKK